MQLPVALRYGFAASVAGLALWFLEWGHGGEQNILLLPVYLCLLGAWVFLIRASAPLARMLHHAWRSAFVLWLLLSLATFAALRSAIPLRTWIAGRANDGSRRWYFEGMPHPENDLTTWLDRWQGGGILFFEATVFAAFFIILLLPCVFATRRRFVWSGLLAGIALLAIAPLMAGLLAPDYDLFLLGIALDSIALSIWPFGIAYGDAHLVFPLGFLTLVFGVCLGFEGIRRHFAEKQVPPVDATKEPSLRDPNSITEEDPYRAPGSS